MALYIPSGGSVDGCGVVGPEDVEGVVPLVVVGGLASEGVKEQSSVMKSNASIAMYPFSLCPRTASIRIFKKNHEKINVFLKVAISTTL